MKVYLKAKMSLVIILMFITFGFSLLSVGDVFGSDVETEGDILAIAIPAVATGMILAHKDKDGFGQFVEVMGATAIVTLGLKQLIDKKRPNGESQSFPSAHTSLAFAGAGFIQQRYGWKYGIPAYLGASFVGWSRVDAKQHYTEDVLAGAAIGIVSNLIFTKRYQDKKVVVNFAPIEKGAAVTISLFW